MSNFLGSLPFNDAGHELDLVQIARRALRDARLQGLSYHREEEVLRDLVLAAWQLSEKHDAQRYPGKFEAGCYRVLRLRLKGELRERLGRTTWKFSDRTHERERPLVLSLDRTEPDGSSLGDSVREGVGDPSDDRSPELARALLRRDRSDDGPDAAAGERPAGRAGRRDPGAVADTEAEAA